MTNLKEILILVLTSLALQATCQRSKESMYYKFDGVAACFALLNGTHQFGCTSSHKGNVGVLHIIEKEEDLTWLIKEGRARYYMTVLTPSMFTRDVMLQIKNSRKVNGVFLVSDPSKPRPLSFSHEDSCPNRYSGLSSLETQTCGSDSYPTWNPKGTGLLLENWGMPIFFSNNATHLEDLISCAAHNTQYSADEQLSHPLCALEMNAHMFAAVDSRKCMSRKRETGFSNGVFCDPLGGQNVWSTLFPRSTGQNNTEEPRSIIVVGTRMDSSSMFDGVVPGAVSPITGVVTLLTTAALLNKMIPDKSTVPEKNVLFIVFDGEAYDYIGSSRVVFDMQRGVFPVEQLNDSSVTQPPALNLDHIGLFLELGHLAKPNASLFAHLNKPSDRSFQTQAVELLTKEALKVGLNIAALPQTLRLPPASAQSFIKADNNIPTIILADFNESFSYNYHHSVFDDKQALRFQYANGSKIDMGSIQQYIANISTTLARTLYMSVMNQEYTGTETVELDLVDELLYCYLESANCTLFNAVMGREVALNKPVPLYVSVSLASAVAPLITGATLAMLTGTPTDLEKAQCQSNRTTDQVFKYMWVNPEWRDPNHTSVCMKSTMNFTLALSPAFELEDYNMSSGVYSTWTESRWQEFSVRMFLKPDLNHEMMVCGLGISVMLLSFVIVALIKIRSDVLFNTGSSSP